MKRSAEDVPESAAAPSNPNPRAPITSGGWTFSSELSPESLAQIQGMIAMNGLTHPPDAVGGDEAARAAHAAAADAAFAQMVASNPSAVVIGGPAGGGGGGGAPAAGAGGPPVVVDGGFSMPGPAGGSEAERAAHAAAAEEAFARMVAANPGASEVAPGVFSLAPATE